VPVCVRAPVDEDIPQAAGTVHRSSASSKDRHQFESLYAPMNAECATVPFFPVTVPAPPCEERVTRNVIKGCLRLPLLSSEAGILAIEELPS